MKKLILALAFTICTVGAFADDFFYTCYETFNDDELVEFSCKSKSSTRTLKVAKKLDYIVSEIFHKDGSYVYELDTPEGTYQTKQYYKSVDRYGVVTEDGYTILNWGMSRSYYNHTRWSKFK